MRGGGVDFYLVSGRPGGEPQGILMEEFLLREDFSAAGLAGALWTAEAGWAAGAGFSRRVRVDAELRELVVPVGREAAERAYRELGGGELPGEAALRELLGDAVGLGTEPLLLREVRPPAGFRERRVYRLLLAGTPGEREVAVPAALAVDGHEIGWELRRIGAGIAWAVDVTVYLGEGDDRAVGEVLRGLRARVREQGLIPVTIERFA